MVVKTKQVYIICFMKCLFILIFNFLIFVNINLVKSETYSIEAYSNSKVTGDTELPNNTNYRTISLEGMWKDSLGQIGLLNAFGKVESLSGKPYLEVIGVFTNESGDTMWNLYKRKSTDVEVGGGGVSTFIAGTGRYEFLVGYECNFVARYLEGRNFTVQKCDIPKEILQKMTSYKK